MSTLPSPRFARAVFSLLTFVVASFTICNVKASAALIQQDKLNSILSGVDTVTLEENANVLTVDPQLYTSGASDTLYILDRKEAQVRLYDNEGNLLRYFGGRGPGPTELQHPVSLSLRDNHYLVANVLGEIKSFSPREDSVTDIWKTGMGPLYRHLPVDRSHLLLVGNQLGRRGLQAERHMLHYWNLTSQKLQRSFFVPPDIEHVSRAAAASIGWASADIKNDTIAAIYALSDTLYLYTTAGEKLEKIHVSPSEFQYPSEDAPKPKRGVATLEKWTHTFTRLNQVFWVRDDSFLVTYINKGESGTTRNMVWLKRDGTEITELKDIGNIKHVSNDGRVYVFPSAVAPNRLLVGRLKPSEVVDD